jgi:hypothetical protein
VIFRRCASDFNLWQHRLRSSVDKFCIKEWSSFTPVRNMAPFMPFKVGDDFNLMRFFVYIL